MKRYFYIFSLIIIASVNYAMGQVAVISEYYYRSGTPEGGNDENVFDIQQGVAICFMIKYKK